MAAAILAMTSGPSKLRALAYEAAAWMIRDTLERNGGNVRAAAIELGVNRQALYRIASRVGVKIVRSARKPEPGPLYSPEFRRFLGARAQV